MMTFHTLSERSVKPGTLADEPLLNRTGHKPAKSCSAAVSCCTLDVLSLDCKHSEVGSPHVDSKRFRFSPRRLPRAINPHPDALKGRAMNKLGPSRPPSALALLAVMIAALAFIAILDFGPLVGIGANANAVLTLLAALIFVVAHGYIALGWRNIVAFILITVAVSFTSEAIGVATGLIFGRYHYTDLLGPKLLGVPPLIQIGYLATGYASSGTMAAVISAFLSIITPAGSAPSSSSCSSICCSPAATPNSPGKT
jgi:carotenoid biosynthesis protein